MWRYVHIDETRQGLLENGIIDLSGDVDEDMAMYVREALIILATKGNPDIKIIITSNGGNVKIGFNIYDMIRNYPGRITGEVNAFCRSIAMVILQACRRRTAMSNASLKIHNVKQEDVSLNDLRNKKKLAALIASLEWDQNRINSLYSQHSGQSLRSINRLSNADRDMKVEEALALGLIDEII